jgi:dienelactone hydrolase
VTYTSHGVSGREPKLQRPHFPGIQRERCPGPGASALQVHVSEGDKWFNREGGEQLVSEVPGAELFLYPGSGHLFTDRSWEEYDEAATTLVMERSLAFLDRVG